MFRNLLFICFIYLIYLVHSQEFSNNGMRVRAYALNPVDHGYHGTKVYPIVDTFDYSCWLRFMIHAPANFKFDTFQYLTTNKLLLKKDPSELSCVYYYFNHQYNKKIIPLNFISHPDGIEIKANMTDLLPVSEKGELIMLDCYSFHSPMDYPPIEKSYLNINNGPVLDLVPFSFDYHNLDHINVTLSNPTPNEMSDFFYSFQHTPRISGGKSINVYDYVFFGNELHRDLQGCYLLNRNGERKEVFSALWNNMLKITIDFEKLTEKGVAFLINVVCTHRVPNDSGRFARKIYGGTDNHDNFAGLYDISINQPSF